MMSQYNNNTLTNNTDIFTVKYTLSKCVNMSITGQCHRELSSTTDLLNSLVAKLIHFLKAEKIIVHLYYMIALNLNQHVK